MKAQAHEELFGTLMARFAKHATRHKAIAWADVLIRLQAASPGKLRALHAMEASGGEPDVIGREEQTGEFMFCDCVAESPAGRRSLCYDRQALESRKENKPAGSAIDQATEMGIEMLTEDQYRHLQQLGEFDLKTSSWIATPAGVRQLGGALFCDRRYGHVFVYHNGVQSYYAARGFRGSVAI
ncbi:MAG: DUF4256 domain-containing protein [Ideonella sp.]